MSRFGNPRITLLVDIEITFNYISNMNSVRIIVMSLIMFVLTCWEDVEEPPEVDFVSDRDYYPVFQNIIHEADESISAVMYLAKFHGTNYTQVNRILDDLVEAHSEGVNLKIVLEVSSWDYDLNNYNREFIDSLDKYGIEANFDDSLVATHAKCVVVDSRVVLLGSTNWTTSALERNREVNIKISNNNIGEEVEAYINRIWEEN